MIVAIWKKIDTPAHKMEFWKAFSFMGILGSDLLKLEQSFIITGIVLRYYHIPKVTQQFGMVVLTRQESVFCAFFNFTKIGPMLLLSSGTICSLSQERYCT